MNRRPARLNGLLSALGAVALVLPALGGVVSRIAAGPDEPSDAVQLAAAPEEMTEAEDSAAPIESTAPEAPASPDEPQDAPAPEAAAEPTPAAEPEPGRGTIPEDNPELAFFPPANPAAGRLKPWLTLTSEDHGLPISFRVIEDDYSGSRPASACQIYLNRGKVRLTAAPVGRDGITKLPNVREGRQSVVASGDDGFAAFGIYVAPEHGSVPSVEPPYIRGGLTPRSDVELVQELLKEHRAKGADAIERHVIPEEALGNVELHAGHNFRLDQDGVLAARLVTLERDLVRASPAMDVFVIRRGEVIARSKSDEWGVFELRDPAITPGFVSFVATGPDGYVVFGAQLDGPSAVAVLDETGPAEFVSVIGADLAPVFVVPAGWETSAALASPIGGGAGLVGGGLGGAGAGAAGSGYLLPAAGGLGGAATGFISRQENQIVSPSGF